MLGRRSLSFDLNPYNPEIERTLREIRASHKISTEFNFESKIETEINMGEEQPRQLSEYFTLGTYTSPVGSRMPIITRRFEIKPQTIQLLPSFYGLESENPYKHIDEFLEVCSTFNQPDVPNEEIYFLLFPFSLKDKAKHWWTTKENITNWQNLVT